MLDRYALSNAAEELMTAVVLRKSWRPIMDRLAVSVNANGTAISRPMDGQVVLMTSSSLDWTASDVKAGRVPPVPKESFITRRGVSGFVSNAHPALRAHMERFPYYRDYLTRVADLPHCASAVIEDPSNIGDFRLSFWRSSRQGAFDKPEIDLLADFLPHFRAAILFSQHGFRLQAEAQAQVFRGQSEYLFKLGSDGALDEMSREVVALSGDPLRVLQGRLATAARQDQRGLNALIARAVAPSPKPGAATVTRSSDGQKLFVLMLPLNGEGRDVMSDAAAIGALIDPTRLAEPSPASVALLREATALTDREAKVAGLVTSGLSVEKISARLGISIGTVRTHVKSSLQKCGVHSQVELAALMRRFG